MNDEFSSVKKELQKYRGDVIPVTDAVPIIARATGLRVHLLREDEIPDALEYAKQLITSGRVRRGPYNVKNEVVKGTRESWTDLSQLARSLVATLWSEKSGADLVLTTLDSVQTKNKILSIVENILEQKKRFALGQRQS